MDLMWCRSITNRSQTSGNIELNDVDVVTVRDQVHPAPVRPAVLWHELVHPDGEEGSSGVVIQRETSTSHQPLTAICR